MAINQSWLLCVGIAPSAMWAGLGWAGTRASLTPKPRVGAKRSEAEHYYEVLRCVHTEGRTMVHELLKLASRVLSLMS